MLMYYFHLRDHKTLSDVDGTEPKMSGATQIFDAFASNRLPQDDSIMPSPGRVRSRNDMRVLTGTEIQRVESS
jgi:hypothetical protein